MKRTTMYESSFLCINYLLIYPLLRIKGLSGIVRFTGSTPDLGEFSIRVEDGVFR
jgi:hypothetical protein